MERIIFLGHLREADLLQLFNVADIVLDSLPSSEPLTSLQALNFGTPLLTLQTSASASLLQAFSPSLCVQLVQPNSTEWVKQLITLSQQPEALLALKTALRTEALAYFSPQRHTHVKTAFWQTLLNAVQPTFV
jgi:predicted O-linked N-acetylglucosamine transferase (SPINDLY family)